MCPRYVTLQNAIHPVDPRRRRGGDRRRAGGEPATDLHRRVLREEQAHARVRQRSPRVGDGSEGGGGQRTGRDRGGGYQARHLRGDRRRGRLLHPRRRGQRSRYHQRRGAQGVREAPLRVAVPRPRAVPRPAGYRYLGGRALLTTDLRQAREDHESHEGERGGRVLRTRHRHRRERTRDQE